MKNYDIAIIGYGPVGAVTANLFGQKGFNTIVIVYIITIHCNHVGNQ